LRGEEGTYRQVTHWLLDRCGQLFGIVGGVAENGSRTDQAPRIAWRKIILPHVQSGVEQQRDIGAIIHNHKRPRLFTLARHADGLLEDDTTPVSFMTDLEDSRASIQHRAGSGFQRTPARFEQRAVKDRVQAGQIQFSSYLLIPDRALFIRISGLSSQNRTAFIFSRLTLQLEVTSKMKLKTIVLGLAVAAILAAQQRFDLQVRDDFFAGFAGNSAAMDRAMKACEDVLANNAKHAEALVWHGGGLFYLGGQAFQKGDATKGMELYDRGLTEMEKAVSLEPDNVGVLIPRGATLITATRFIPPGDSNQKLLAQGLADYEKVYKLQNAYFDSLSDHARGELLFGLAEGYYRAGNEGKAREYFEKLLAVGPGSGHEAEAKAWLATRKLDSKRVRCTGCHSKA
jgi:tetratricopeptide (TPR) repeat protein